MHRAVILAIALALLAGCGSTRPAAAPKQSHAARMKAVVRAWSRHLNAAEYRALVPLFRLPATMIQGPYVFHLLTPKQVTEWHAALPCAGKVVSISVHGRYATGVYRLGDRKGARCDAPGALAAARFLIVNGRIVTWQQVPPPQQQAPVA